LALRNGHIRCTRAMMKHYTSLLFALLMAPSAWSQGYAELDISGVRARFLADGQVAYDNQNQIPQFEVPQGGGASALYFGSPWVGGMSQSSQIRFSGPLYGQDSTYMFFPGPLTVDGTASTTQDISDQFDQVWKIDRADVALHLAYYNCLSDPNCDVAAAFPSGYSIPAEFLDWPAHGPDAGYDIYLAPFYDFDLDGAYVPANGDAPCILGDQALYAVFGDHLNLLHGGLPMGIEVQAMPFTYDSGDPMLDQTVFVRYHVINRSSQTYTDVMLGFFNDFDLGCANDDFVGTDAGRNMVYVYNWADYDLGCLGAQGYGPQPPAFGMCLLKGPLMDADATANSSGDQQPAWNGQGFGDAIVDNERHGVSRSMYISRQSPNVAITDPATTQQYVNYLNGLWRDGAPLSYGGDGYSLDPNAVQCDFMYPGSSDPVGAGTNGVVQTPWSEAGPTPSTPDRRGLMSSGPITLEPGQHVDLLYAYVYARAATGGAIASVAALQARVDSVRAFTQTLPIWNVPEEDGFNGQCVDYLTISVEEGMGLGQLMLAPSPATEEVRFTAPRQLVGGLLTLRDATGRTIVQQRILPERNTIDVSALARGVYLCEAVARNARFTGRVVKE
jgi:hypothetical protein